jgi:hypothetical protein
MIGTSAANTRIGDLLVRAGIVSQEQLANASSRAVSTGEHLGQAMIRCGYIDPQALAMAVNIQSALKDGVISPFTARKALALAYRSKQGLKHAFTQLGIRPTEQSRTNRLGELLLESHVISQSQLADALAEARKNNLPLGKVLVMLGFISEAQKAAALELQARIRDGMTSREQAIDVVGAGDKVRNLFAALGLSDALEGNEARTRRLKDALRKQRAAGLRQAYQRLVTHYVEKGELVQALSLLRRVVELSRTLYAWRDQRLVADLVRYGEVLFSSGRLIEAEAVLTECVGLVREAAPVDDARLAYCLHRVAVIKATMGLKCEAETSFLNAIALWKSRGYANDIRLADTCFDYARYLKAIGELKRAEKVYREARSVLEEYALLELLEPMTS